MFIFTSKRLASIPSSSWKTQDGMRPRPCSSLRTLERSTWHRTCSHRSCTRRGVSKSKGLTKWKVQWNNPWYESKSILSCNKLFLFHYTNKPNWVLCSHCTKKEFKTIFQEKQAGSLQKTVTRDPSWFKTKILFSPWQGQLSTEPRLLL